MRIAAHAIIDRLLTVGVCTATDLDDLPPAESGSRTYVGTAFLDLRRAGVIRTDGPPVPTTVGGRHSPFLFRWRLVSDAAAALAYKAAFPIPTEADVDDAEPTNEDARRDGTPGRADVLRQNEGATNHVD
ncbi:hypothetical protein [Paludisphaera soli]|uniref:hypothetical protein n=1 Tax=Paludisphaera soli TaxID=2712865 RepID=UPI0013EB2D86|nr:hypothetical protein [Paludisphaera soli]